MLSGRMLKVIDYLQINNETTYKKISIDLEIKERYIRYDIDRINDFFHIKNLPLIEKQSKGCIVFPKSIEVSDLTKENDFIYSQEERTSLILLILLIDNQRLKINRLSKDFQVSRSTIKNDMSFIEGKLFEEGIKISYTDRFFLDGPKNKRVALMTKELIKYVYLLKDENLSLNTFEAYAVEVIEKAFEGVSLKEVIEWIDDLLESMDCILREDFYKWYVANVFTVIWFVIRSKENPLESTINSEYSDKYNEFMKKLEAIINKEIDYKKLKVLNRLINYVNKDVVLDGDFDLIYMETIVSKLIEAMSKAMNIDFTKDSILIDGLSNHIVLLIKRAKGSIYINNEVLSIIPEKDIVVVDTLAALIKDIEGLREVTDYDEISYLAVHFIASMRRLTKATNKQVLLVCGHGYGSTNMLKESLLNEYQIDIVDIIPVYKLTSYSNWNNVDYIISTTKLNNSSIKKYVIVNPILSNDDYASIDRLGIERKSTVLNYNSINEKLNFLKEKDRRKVLDIIKNELGYGSVITSTRVNSISGLLSDDCIEIMTGNNGWREVVKEGIGLLERQKFIDERYEKDIIKTIESVGFYSVTDNLFALIHGRGDEGVNRSCMSLIVSNEPVEFGEKKVKIVFCLASKDKKEHIPAMVLLMRMIKSTRFIERLENAKSIKEIKEILYETEMEVAF